MEKIATEVDSLPKTPTISDVRSKDRDVAALNHLLRGEISAVDTYGQCIERVTDPLVLQRLLELRNAHERRREHISNRICFLGGEPDTHSGAWGTVAGMAEGGAALVGEQAALDMLEWGEQHGMRTYENIGEVSSATRNFIANVLLPEQRHTATQLRAVIGKAELSA